MTVPARAAARTLLLFNYDWDQTGFARWADRFAFHSDGIDLHRMALELAWGRDPGLLGRDIPVAGVVSVPAPCSAGRRRMPIW